MDMMTVTNKYLGQMMKELKGQDVHILIMIYDNKTEKTHNSYYGCIACIKDIFMRSIGRMKLTHNKDTVH